MLHHLIARRKELAECLTCLTCSHSRYTYEKGKNDKSQHVLTREQLIEFVYRDKPHQLIAPCVCWVALDEFITDLLRSLGSFHREKPQRNDGTYRSDDDGTQEYPGHDRNDATQLLRAVDVGYR